MLILNNNGFYKKAGTLTEAVLTKLQQCPTGVMSSELVPLTHRFGAQIHILRNLGYVIRAEKLDNKQWKYTLIGHEDSGYGTTTIDPQLEGFAPEVAETFPPTEAQLEEQRAAKQEREDAYAESIDPVDPVDSNDEEVATLSSPEFTY